MKRGTSKNRRLKSRFLEVPQILHTKSSGLDKIRLYIPFQKKTNTKAEKSFFQKKQNYFY